MECNPFGVKTNRIRQSCRVEREVSFFRFSYGDELTMHIGKPEAYTSPRMKHIDSTSEKSATASDDYFPGTEASRQPNKAGKNEKAGRRIAPAGLFASLVCLLIPPAR